MTESAKEKARLTRLINREKKSKEFYLRRKGEFEAKLKTETKAEEKRYWQEQLTLVDAMIEMCDQHNAEWEQKLKAMGGQTKTAKTVKKVEKPTKVTTATLPKTGVNVWNYNEWTHFPTRKKALDYYNRAARGSEGSERDRYFNIICQLEEGGINEILPNRDTSKDIYPDEREIVVIDNDLEVKRWKQ